MNESSEWYETIQSLRGKNGYLTGQVNKLTKELAQKNTAIHCYETNHSNLLEEIELLKKSKTIEFINEYEALKDQNTYLRSILSTNVQYLLNIQLTERVKELESELTKLKR
jgi:hypothetical protein